MVAIKNVLRRGRIGRIERREVRLADQSRTRSQAMLGGYGLLDPRDVR